MDQGAFALVPALNGAFAARAAPSAFRDNSEFDDSAPRVAVYPCIMSTTIHTVSHHRTLPQHLRLPNGSTASRHPRRSRAPKPVLSIRRPEPCPLSQAELRAIVLETMG